MHFDTTKYKVWTWKHPLMLHWVINPGLAINELLLGQTVPKVSLVEKNTKKSFAERSFVPCPHCHTIHPAMNWSVQNKTAFGNWFGLYCSSCGGIIPPLRNLTTLILLAVTSPVWIWFYRRWKNNWLKTQRNRFSKPMNTAAPKPNWVAMGLGWGALMFIFSEVIAPLVYGDPYELIKIVIGIAVWTAGGLLFGWMIRKVFLKQHTEKSTGEVAGSGG